MCCQELCICKATVGFGCSLCTLRVVCLCYACCAIQVVCVGPIAVPSPCSCAIPGFPRNPSLASLPLLSTVPPVRWLFELNCARVLRAGRIQRISQTVLPLRRMYGNVWEYGFCEQIRHSFVKQADQKSAGDILIAYTHDCMFNTLLGIRHFKPPFWKVHLEASCAVY